MKNASALRFWAPAVLAGVASLAVLTPAVEAQAPQQSAVQSSLDKAHQLEVRGRLNLADQVWRQVLLADPNNTEALGGRARAAKLAGTPDGQNTFLIKLRSINPNDPGIARVANMGTQQDNDQQLQQAGRLAQQGQYRQSIEIYRKLYGNNPPPGDLALSYYETEAASEELRPDSVAGLRRLMAANPGDSRYQIALGRILTYDPKTRPEGRRLLSAHPGNPQAMEALRQSLLWDARNPATAGDIRAYLAQHPDAQLTQALHDQPVTTAGSGGGDGRRGGGKPAPPMTAEQRAAAAAYATRTAADRAAYAQLNAKHVPQAEAMFTQILHDHPDDANALAGMGYVRMQQQNFAAALTFLLQARSDGSKDPAVDTAIATSSFYNKMSDGNRDLLKDDLPAATADYRAALMMRPNDPDALEAVGGVLLKQNQDEAAVPYFERYIKVSPNAPHAWRGLFLAQSQDGKNLAAIETARRFPQPVRVALVKDPLFLRQLAIAYQATGHDADAQRVLKAALELPVPADSAKIQVEDQLQYADLLAQANRLEQAAGLYRQVLARDQNNLKGWQGLVRVEHAEGKDAEALQTLESTPQPVYEKAMMDPGFESTVASIEQSQRKLDVAEDILTKAINEQVKAGQKPVVGNEIQLAGLYMLRNEPALAYPIYQQILSAAPDNTDAWKGLLSSLHTAGRDREVLAEVQVIPPAVRAKLEDDPVYLQTIGGVYNGLGDPREAEVFFRRVQDHYGRQHAYVPGDIDVQEAWLLYNAGDESALYRQLLELGGRPDLTGEQRRTVQLIWANLSVRRANELADAGNPQKAVAILNSAAQAFGDNPEVPKVLAGGYAHSGQAKRAVLIWKTQDPSMFSVGDYRSAIGSALADNDAKDAETWLRFALNQYPHDPDLLVLAAKFEESRGDNQRAADYYRASLSNMPPADPGAQLAGELGRPVQTSAAPRRPAQDLATLLKPGTDDRGLMDRQSAQEAAQQQQRNGQPYLPSGSNFGAAPVPMYAQPMNYGAGSYGTGTQALPSTGAGMQSGAGMQAVPMSGRRSAPASTSVVPLGAYQPQSAGQPQEPVYQPYQPQQQGAPAYPQPQQPAYQQPQSMLGQPALTGTELRVTVHQASFTRAQAVVQDAIYRGSSEGRLELSANGMLHLSAYQQTTTPPQQMGVTAQPAHVAPPTPQQQGTQQPGMQPGVVYGPYVPLTTTPTQPGAKPEASQIYGPYVPYKPATVEPVQPAVPSVQLGATPPTRSLAKPEVTDVVPTVKYVPNANAVSGTSSHPEVNAANAAAARRRQSQPLTGESNPPAETYDVAPTEAVRYGQTGQVAQPARGTNTGQTANGQQTGSQTTTFDPNQTGDSSSQQYPQPGGTYTPGRARSRAIRHAAATPAPAVAAPAPAPSYQGLSYPGVGEPLGGQPYPALPATYQLGPAPTDNDLMARRLPSLGGRYGGDLLPPPLVLTPRQQTERDLETLESSYSGWLGGTASARYRSGLAGLDRLTDLEAGVEASVTVGNNVRFTIVPRAVFLNSGNLDNTNYVGLTGTALNGVPVLGTLSASAPVAPATQPQSGVGGEIQVATNRFAAAIGYTPYEFLVQNYTGRVLYKPTNHFTIFADRSAVTETELSYAGLRDPGSAGGTTSGRIWGGVVQTGGGVRLDAGDERAGFYLTFDGADITGYHVLENSKFEGSAGAYFLAHTFPGYGRLNIGGSLFGMHYQYNERGLTYGLGGYFSPTAYFLASVPVTFTGHYKENFHYTVAGAVGVQTFQEARQNYFPLDTALQGTATNQFFPVNSNTGGNYSINTEGAYRITEHWFGGGFLTANNTNNYNTVTGGFFVRYTFRPQFGNEAYPTGIFPVDGFRPLRVP